MGGEVKDFIWIFNGAGAQFPAGAFGTLQNAEKWIATHHLSGVLTKYPVDSGAYDWALLQGLFKPTNPEHSSAAFIQKFGCASFEHYHFENGRRA
jgi:hypothetical protein